MEPEALARELAEELRDILAYEAIAARLVDVSAPPDLDPESVFTLRLERRGQLEHHTLPAGLVAAYFADEEAAVDQWKGFIRQLAAPG